MNVGDVVIVPGKGRGTVSFYEDGYMTVDLSNGVEVEVSPKVVKPVVSQKEASEIGEAFWKAVEEYINQKTPEIVALAKFRFSQAGKAVRALGGSSVEWEGLQPWQRLNVIETLFGIPTEEMASSMLIEGLTSS